MIENKKLVYVVNQVHENDATHLFHILNLLRMLKERGWAVTLISERGGRGTKHVAGHEVLYLSRASYLGRAVEMAKHLFGLRRLGYRTVFVRISKLPAIVSIVVGRLVGLKVLYWQSAANFDIDRRKPFVRRAFDDFSFNLIKWGIDGFVSGPESMLEYYATQYGVPRRKLRLLYNDVDTRRFSPQGKSSYSNTTVQILFVHRFSPIRQTWQYMPAIMRQLALAAAAGFPANLVMIGDGPERKLVEQSVGAGGPGVGVSFHGEIPNAQLPEHYSKADIFIMPSYREGFPRVVVEAMAAGLPVVTTDAGGTRDVLGPKQQKYVVSKDDPEGFAQRLADLVRNRALREELAQENLSHVQRYSSETVAAMLERLLLSRSDDQTPSA